MPRIAIDKKTVKDLNGNMENQNTEKEELIHMLSQYKTDIEAFDKYNDTSLKDIMEFYSIKKKEYEKNEVFYKRKYSL